MTILKRFAGSLLAATLILASAAPKAYAGDYANFIKVEEYLNNFTDISTDDWFWGDVESASKAGLLKGKTYSTFDPYGRITLAEAAALVSRIHSIYNGSNETFEHNSDEPWYRVYEEYAVSNGLMKQGEFPDLEKNATRAELAYLFFNALGDEGLPQINSVANIPDVDGSEEYKKEILALYNAGIVMGNDAYGTFNPDESITRAEVSAIVSRAAFENKRLTRILLDEKSRVNIYSTEGSTVTSFSAAGRYLASEMMKGNKNIDMKELDIFGDGLSRTEIVDALKDYILSANTQNPLIFGIESFVYRSDGMLSVNYTYDTNYQMALQDAVKEKVSEIIKEIIKPGMTYIEREIAINNYLCDNVEYDNDAAQQLLKYGYVEEEHRDSFNAYGALIKGIAVCEGYAEAFKLLCDQAQITSIVVTGKLDDIGHAWNRVYISGKWYDVDVTNNDKTQMPNSALNLPMHIADLYLYEDSYYITDDLLGKLERGTDQNYEFYRYAGKYVEKENVYSYLVENIKKNGSVTFRTSSDYTMANLKRTLTSVLDNISGSRSLSYVTRLGVVYVNSSR
ncbi:MAG: S-layer homology domain-containing protein [Sedimentibacter sp.]|uniref:S-layer homology domain-containing protein n=1 Tax=Sedimentibacter sp. TaxID=1960295 RepID=UPI003158F149